MKRITTLIIFVLTLAQHANSQKSLQVLRQNISALAPLAGDWQVSAREIAPDGRATPLHGTYKISWALDSTYIRIAASLEEDASHKKRGFECLITYNPDSSQYEFSYFYTRQAFR